MAHDYEWNQEAVESQQRQVRNYLLQGNSITQLEALNLFGSLRLSAIIFNLRKEGMDIVMERYKTPSGKYVGKYYIRK